MVILLPANQDLTPMLDVERVNTWQRINISRKASSGTVECFSFDCVMSCSRTGKIERTLYERFNLVSCTTRNGSYGK